MPVTLDLELVARATSDDAREEILRDTTLEQHFWEFASSEASEDTLEVWAALGQICSGVDCPSTIRKRVALGQPRLQNAAFPSCVWVFEEYISNIPDNEAPKMANIEGTVRDKLNQAYLAPPDPEGKAAPGLGPKAMETAWKDANDNVDYIYTRWKVSVGHIRAEMLAALEKLESNKDAIAMMKLRDDTKKNIQSFNGGRFFIWGPMIDGQMLLVVTNGDRSPLKDHVILADRTLLKSSPKRARQGLWAQGKDKGKRFTLVDGDSEDVRLFKKAMEAMGVSTLGVETASRDDVIAQISDPKYWASKNAAITASIEREMDRSRTAPTVEETGPTLTALAATTAGYKTLDEALTQGGKMAERQGQGKAKTAITTFDRLRKGGTLNSTQKDLLGKLEKKAGTGFWCLLYAQPGSGTVKYGVWLFRGTSISGLTEPGRPDKASWLLLGKY